MLQRHRHDRGWLADIAHRPDERRDGPDARVTCAQRGELARDVEILGLDADGHCVSERQPPVTGGNSAISSPGGIGVSGSARS